MNAKIHSSSFYLSGEFLDKVDCVAQILGISRSVLIERAVFGKEKGYAKADKTIKMRQNAQKVPTKRGKYKANRQKRQKVQYEQKCLFDYVCGRLSFICV